MKTQLFPLVCKPKTHEILYAQFCPVVHGTISFRSLNLKTDLPVIHEWVNMDYAIEHWQMNGAFSQLHAIYQCMEYNPYAHSFVGLLNGKMICQYDVYSIMADELNDHLDPNPHDCGFHLLMSPNTVPIPGLTKNIVSAFLQYYFSFRQSKRMYAEPDIHNEKSIALLEKCGFTKVKTVLMSYKTADIYFIEK